MLTITHIAAQGRGGAAGARAGNQPTRLRVLFKAHLLEDRFGDVVVRPPVGGTLGVGELVHEVPPAFLGQAFGFGVDLRRVLDQMALATVEGNLGDLLLGRGRGHDGNKRQAEQAREVGFRDRRRAAGRFNNGGARLEPAIAQRIQEQRARQPVFQAAGGVAGLILEVQLDAWQTR